MRKSGVELLRIMAMFSILISHYCVHNVLLSVQVDNIMNKIILTCGILGDLSVDIFFLLMGYFLIKKNFSIYKFFKLESEVLFYSISIFIIECVMGGGTFRGLIFALFPTVFMKYSFFYHILYIVLCLTIFKSISE